MGNVSRLALVPHTLAWGRPSWGQGRCVFFLALVALAHLMLKVLWKIAWPMTVSWCLADYDAVLTEAGDYTEKYFKLRKLFGSVLGT